MAFVWRVEDVDTGSGFYGDAFIWYPKDVRDYFLSTDIDLDIHPLPDDDPGLKGRRHEAEDWNYRFGFSCLEQFHNWFPCWVMERIHDRGVKLTLYQVDDDYVLHGERQSVFDLGHAKKIRSFPPGMSDEELEEWTKDTLPVAA